MERIFRIRDEINRAEKDLKKAYAEIFAPGVKVVYCQGVKEITVEVLQPWGSHRCQVHNAKTGLKYLLDYDRIDHIEEEVSDPMIDRLLLLAG